MDEFGVLTERFGLKPQGKSAPMSASRGPNNAQTRDFPSSNPKSNSYSSKSTYNSNSYNGSFMDDHETLLRPPSKVHQSKICWGVSAQN